MERCSRERESEAKIASDKETERKNWKEEIKYILSLSLIA
jgi:hypothetical protein